jgi:hypothetical protein
MGHPLMDYFGAKKRWRQAGCLSYDCAAPLTRFFWSDEGNIGTG